MSKQYLVIPLEEITETQLIELAKHSAKITGNTFTDSIQKIYNDAFIQGYKLSKQSGTTLSISDDVEERAIKFCDKGIRAGYVSRKEGYIKGATDQQVISELKMVELVRFIGLNYYLIDDEITFSDAFGKHYTETELIKLFNNHLKEVK